MYQDVLLKQKDFLKTNITNNYKYRLNKLVFLRRVIGEYTNKITDALYDDLSKSGFESYLTEVSMVLSELNYLIKNLKKLLRPIKVRTPLIVQPAKSYIVPERLGTVLIISPWNYPFLLALNPIIGAISAGNTVVFKPSEYSVSTNKVLIEILSKIFTSNEVTIIEGGILETTNLLKLKFDHIFFTGSSKVGKVIMEAASKHLTPVTLELGGKSPAIIMSDANIKLAAKRIAFGKLVNAGQTCIAPDYLIINSSLLDDFIKYYKYYIDQFYSNNPLDNKDYPKIINENHYKRLINLIKDEELIFGGNYSNNKIEPTLLKSTINSNIMKDEIFGPILPIIIMDEIEEIINYLSNIDKPLASYIFTNNKSIKKTFISKTSSGSITFNDTIIQFANGNLPFGGIGNSGMGKYHKAETFKTFSHYKAILDKKNYLDFSIRYQPYTKRNNVIKKFIK